MSSRRWRTRRRASAHAALGSGRAAVTLATLAVMVNSVPFRASQLGCMCRAAGFVTSGCLAECEPRWMSTVKLL